MSSVQGLQRSRRWFWGTRESAGVRNVPLLREAPDTPGETREKLRGDDPNEAVIMTTLTTLEQEALIGPTAAELELVQQTTASIEANSWTDHPLTTGEKLCIEMAVMYTLSRVN